MPNRRRRANNSFKPNLLRSTNNMAERACHVVGCATQVGLTQALEDTRDHCMNRRSHEFFVKPPWSGQPVRPWIRFLAWTFVVLTLLAGISAAVFITLEGGVPREQLPVLCLFVAGELYFVSLLSYVGVKGVAPSSWLPWK
ncbi:hypothetical protein ACW7G0_14060 [Lysobacter sp. A286]